MGLTAKLKVMLGRLIFMIFIFHKACYKFVTILFHDDTIINMQYDKKKDAYNVSFSSTKHSMAKTDSSCTYILPDIHSKLASE